MKQSLPIADKLFSLAKDIGVDKLLKSSFKTALVYLLNQEPYLRNVFLDGRLELSNNRAERSIKPFVIGRKNWLFCVSEDGATTSAIIYLIVETARANGISLVKYLEYVLIYVCLYFSKYPYSESSPWNEKNKLRYLYRPETGLTEQELLACIKKAILSFRL